MLLAVFYVFAITLIIMHYTGWLARHNLEWLLYILALTVFPAVLWL
jgi:low affinity Fe/Cu permease